MTDTALSPLDTADLPADWSPIPIGKPNDA